jgi:uncharacterized protein
MQEPANRLDPSVLRLWWCTAGAWALGIVVAASVGIGAAGWSKLLILLVFAVAAGVAVVLPPLRYRRWRYSIRERDVFLSKGALFLTRTLIPYDRIQFVETREGPLDHFFGLNQLIVYTAAGKAGQIPGLAASEAEALREELSRIAGTATV